MQQYMQANVYICICIIYICYYAFVCMYMYVYLCMYDTSVYVSMFRPVYYAWITVYVIVCTGCLKKEVRKILHDIVIVGSIQSTLQCTYYEVQLSPYNKKRISV